MIEAYLGDLTFAYLKEPNKIAICCRKESEIEPIEYLCISGMSVEIFKEPLSDCSFSIIEWRTRRASFKFA